MKKQLFRKCQCLNFAALRPVYFFQCQANRSVVLNGRRGRLPLLFKVMEAEKLIKSEQESTTNRQRK
ncbi:hypothetical protein N8550_00495 [Pirellulaceae bacterium]|nr:hypothetical protein [Pirellulaceae bacterium]